MNARKSDAEWAWDSVQKATTLQAGQIKRYATLARRLPGWLQVNGLGQTLAFLYAKGGGSTFSGAEGLLLEQLSAYLPRDLGKGDSPDPMRRLIQMDSATYRLRTRQIMVASVWLKRFAEGRLGSGEDDV